MILRVWALYGRLKLMLGALFTLYAVEVITTLGYCVRLSTVDGIGTCNVASYRVNYITGYSRSTRSGDRPSA